jgi:hypothetical protein
MGQDANRLQTGISLETPIGYKGKLCEDQCVEQDSWMYVHGGGGVCCVGLPETGSHASGGYRNAGAASADRGGEAITGGAKQRVCGHHQVAPVSYAAAASGWKTDGDSRTLRRPRDGGAVDDEHRPAASAGITGFGTGHGAAEEDALRLQHCGD